MANYNQSHIRVEANEGGFQKIPNDRGNYYCTGNLGWVKGQFPNYYCTNGSIHFIGTNRGIAAPVLATYLDHQITEIDMLSLSANTAKNIFKTNYWDRIKGGNINNQFVADILFDGAVNHGVSRGVKLIQEVLNIPVDGIVGPITLGAINNSDPAIVYNLYKKRRIDFYHQLVANNSTQAVFLQGWLNRMAKFNDYDNVVIINPPEVTPGTGNTSGSRGLVAVGILGLLAFLVFK